MKRHVTQGAQKRVTMKTIADEAGVTLSTVSRILNKQPGQYADDTKKRIFQIADRLRYRPNALVRGMQTGKTHTAGVMVPVDGFYSEIVCGIHEEFLDHQTIMLLSWNSRSLNKPDTILERQIIHQMVDRCVEGILLRPSSEEFEESYFKEIWERHIPLILIDREMTKLKTDFVGTDDLLGGQTAAKHLLSLGHRRMLFVGVGSSVSTSRHREDGFRKVLRATTAAACQSLVIAEASTGEEICQRLRHRDAPTAIFCYNDDTARQVAAVVLKAGFSIPGDISLVGFGNVPAHDSPVALTTFDQHPRKVGAAAARLYFERIRGSDRRGLRRELIPADLVVRNSTRSIY